uniref:Uncharacterized protein n=1 Tax=viral metagenome TaxID=1070528 RepID=A0A6M3LQ88_9ZZZZ
MLTIKRLIERGDISKVTGGYTAHGVFFQTGHDARVEYYRNKAAVHRREAEEHNRALIEANCTSTRTGETIILHFKDGRADIKMPMREYRQRVYELEEKYGQIVSEPRYDDVYQDAMLKMTMEDEY